MLHWLWSNKRRQTNPFQGKVEVFSRHCFFSDASAHKRRPSGFSKQLCHENLLDTIDFSLANLHLILDIAKGETHFLKGQATEIQAGTEAAAFLQLLQLVEEKNFHPDTVLYFVEDDYLHRPGWLPVLLEGMSIPGVDYATLYDHNDKYTFEMYKDLKSKIYATRSCHWRTIPSTTQTFAVRWSTLQRDLPIHRRYSEKRKISADHEKFSLLTRRGTVIISSMPGWSTHAEPEFASPCVDWNELIQQKESQRGTYEKSRA